MKNPPIYNQRMSFSKNEVRQTARFFVQKKNTKNYLDLPEKVLTKSSKLFVFINININFIDFVALTYIDKSVENYRVSYVQV